MNVSLPCGQIQWRYDHGRVPGTQQLSPLDVGENDSNLLPKNKNSSNPQI